MAAEWRDYKIISYGVILFNNNGGFQYFVTESEVLEFLDDESKEDTDNEDN